jgi:O-antigen/teichoic acid export membrane protein
MAKSITSEARVLTRHSLIYGMAPVLSGIVGFIMLPIYTRNLTPADYGILELISITTTLISLVVGVGIQAAVSRFYFDFEAAPERRRVVSTAFLGYGSITALVVIALLPFSGLLAKLILGSADKSILFTVALISLALDILLQIGFSFLRVEQKSVFVTSLTITRTIMALSLNIYFVIVAQKGVLGILLSTLYTSLLFTIILSFYTLRACGTRVNFSLLMKMVKFGLPLMPSDISAYLVHASDRFFLKTYSDMSMTGIYSLGNRIGTMANQFITSPFLQIWGPRRYENFGDPDTERIYARLFTYFIAINLFVGLGISLVSKEVIRIMADEAFWSAYKVVPIVTLAYVIFSFNYHFNVGIIMKKATKYIAYVNISNGILNLILNFILIKRFNIWGAATTILICFIYKNSMMYYFSNRLHKVQIEWRRLATLFAVSILCYFAGIMVATGSMWADIAIKGLVCLVFPMVLYLFKFFTIDEIRKAREILRPKRPALGAE